MARPSSSDSLTRFDLRVHPGAASWLKASAADNGVAATEYARVVLSRGRACIEGRCPATEAGPNAELEQKLRRMRQENARLQGELDAARHPGGVTHPVEQEPWPTVPTAAPADPRAWIPVLARRNLDDRALVAKGVCVQHGQMRADCAAAQLHDEGA